MVKVSLGTIKGRHSLPVTDYVFSDDIQDVTDIVKIQNNVDAYFEEKILPLKEKDDVQIILYVTGLTVVTLAVVNACIKYNCELVCMHFDRDTGIYIAQPLNLIKN